MDTTHSNADLFDRLLEEDFEALKTMFQALDQQIDELTSQEKALAERRQALEVRRSVLASIGQLHALERNERNALVHGTVNERNVRVHLPSRTSAVPSVPTMTRQILDRDPERRWDAEAMHRELHGEGVETRRDNVRVALQRLVKAGEIVRVGHGLYQSALAPSSTLLDDEEPTT